MVLFRIIRFVCVDNSLYSQSFSNDGLCAISNLILKFHRYQGKSLMFCVYVLTCFGNAVLVSVINVLLYPNRPLIVPVIISVSVTFHLLLRLKFVSIVLSSLMYFAVALSKKSKSEEILPLSNISIKLALRTIIDNISLDDCLLLI
jgi:hypothetical protein